MKLSHKIVLGILAVALLAAVVAIIKLQWDLKSQNDLLRQQVVEMKQLQDGIVRSQSEIMSKEDFKKFSDNLDLNLDAIQKDLDQFDANIKGIGTLIATSRGVKATGLPSTNTSPRPEDPNNPNELPTCSDGVCEDPYGYLTYSQHRSLFEPFSDDVQVPIGEVTFEAWKESPWSLNLVPRQYKVNTVLGTDEDGRHYVYNRFQIEADGETHDIPIEQSEFVEEMPEASFKWDPHVRLGVSIGPSIATGGLKPDQPRVRAEVQPTLDVSLFSYGQTRVNPEWMFLGIGIGYETQNNDLGILINPVDYNIGEHIPLINNLYLGPTIGTDLSGNIFVGGGIRVGL